MSKLVKVLIFLRSEIVIMLELGRKLVKILVIMSKLVKILIFLSSEIVIMLELGRKLVKILVL